MHAGSVESHLGAVEKESAAEIASRSGEGLPSSAENVVKVTNNGRPASDFGWVAAAIGAAVGFMLGSVVLRGRR